ncbi:MAG: UDP-2,4-diacetamido-2,4,6-trideoxy-beta-L-altropyranose hydrolase, partial [Alphaproteobacteria bacterium]|nr:UDP-2,4-diacetamido-2,4,6-trideoxy-beta-L-altropyranose hydrolase [Alphaproteobacteria bacterium]
MPSALACARSRTRCRSPRHRSGAARGTPMGARRSTCCCDDRPLGRQDDRVVPRGPRMKQPPTVSFRADAGVTLGGGHVMRCLALATEMRRWGWVVHFATGPETAAVVPALGRAGIAVRVVGTAGELESAQATEVDLAVFDHYALDETAERRARRWARRIMVIDDLANRRHDADVLLDGTLDRRAEDYRGLVTDDCRLLLGPDYALVRPRFAAARRHRRVAPGASPCILVSLGATDPERVAEAVLAGLARHAGRLAVTVVTGAATEHLAAIRAAAAASPHAVDVRVDVTDMAALMAAADLAIGGAGTSAWERCCVGLPSLVIELADNQRGTAAALHRHGAARNLGPASGLDSGKVGTAVHELLADTGGWRRMANAASRVCDGRGVARTLAALAAPVLAGAARVTLRAAEGSDAPR